MGFRTVFPSPLRPVVFALYADAHHTEVETLFRWRERAWQRGVRQGMRVIATSSAAMGP
jgi:hypothetical protein